MNHSASCIATTNILFIFDASRCVQDCEGPSPCGDRLRPDWELPYQTADLCCASQPWVTNCEATPSPTEPLPPTNVPTRRPSNAPTALPTDVSTSLHSIVFFMTCYVSLNAETLRFILASNFGTNAHPSNQNTHSHINYRLFILQMAYVHPAR